MSRPLPSVESYLKKCSAAHRHAFTVIRDLIHNAQSGVSESVRFDIILFDYHGGMLCGFSSRLHEVSLYCKADILENHRQELSHLTLGKGCIRFEKIDDLPLKALYTIIRESCIAFRPD